MIDVSRMAAASPPGRAKSLTGPTARDFGRSAGMIYRGTRCSETLTRRIDGDLDCCARLPGRSGSLTGPMGRDSVSSTNLQDELVELPSTSRIPQATSMEPISNFQRMQTAPNKLPKNSTEPQGTSHDSTIRTDGHRPASKDERQLTNERRPRHVRRNARSIDGKQNAGLTRRRRPCGHCRGGVLVMEDMAIAHVTEFAVALATTIMAAAAAVIQTS